MKIKCGKHQNELVERIIYTDPHYIRWILHVPNPKGWLTNVKQRIESIIASFDRLHFKTECHGSVCDNPATCCVVDHRLSCRKWEFDFWCDECNPSLAAPYNAERYCIRTYREFLSFIHNKKMPNKRAKLLAAELHRAKGVLPNADEDVMELFKTPDPLCPSLDKLEQRLTE